VSQSTAVKHKGLPMTLKSRSVNFSFYSPTTRTDRKLRLKTTSSFQTLAPSGDWMV